jgi:hypothetical protein
MPQVSRLIVTFCASSCHAVEVADPATTGWRLHAARHIVAMRNTCNFMNQKSKRFVNLTVTPRATIDPETVFRSSL